MDIPRVKVQTFHQKWDYLCAIKDGFNKEFATYDVCESQTVMQAYRMIYFTQSKTINLLMKMTVST